MPAIDNMLIAINNGVDVVTTNACGFARLGQTARKLSVKLKFGGAAHMTISSEDLDPFRYLLPPSCELSLYGKFERRKEGKKSVNRPNWSIRVEVQSRSERSVTRLCVASWQLTRRRRKR